MEKIEIFRPRALRTTVYNATIAGSLGKHGVSAKKVRHLYRGIDARGFCPRDPKAMRVTRGRYGLAPEGSVVLLVGRLVPKKGFLKLLVGSLRSAAAGELATGVER